MAPHAMGDAETRDVIERTPRAVVENFCLKGTPKEIASDLQAFVDAGATALFPMDYAPYFVGAESQPHALERQLDLGRALKRG